MKNQNNQKRSKFIGKFAGLMLLGSTALGTTVLGGCTEPGIPAINKISLEEADLYDQYIIVSTNMVEHNGDFPVICCKTKANKTFYFNYDNGQQVDRNGNTFVPHVSNNNIKRIYNKNRNSIVVIIGQELDQQQAQLNQNSVAQSDLSL